MANDPIFFSTPNNGAALLGAAETSLTAPTTTSPIYTTGSTGKIEEVIVQATATTVAGFVYLFRYDGANYWMHDMIVIPALTVAAGSVAGFRDVRRYRNLILKAGGSLRASQSVAGNANLIVASAYGADS